MGEKNDTASTPIPGTRNTHLVRVQVRDIALVIASIILLVVVLVVIGVENVFSELYRADLIVLVLAGVLVFAVILIKGWRWVILYQGVPFKQSFSIFMIGQALHQFLPFFTVNAVRATVGKMKLRIPFGRTIAACVMERVMDTLYLFSMLVIFMVWVIPYQHLFLLALLGLVITAVLLATGILFLVHPQVIDRLPGWYRRLFGARTGWFTKLMGYIYQAFGSFKHAMVEYQTSKRLIGAVLAITIFEWVADALGQYFLLLAFGINVQIVPLAAIVAVSWIIGSFSFLPGGIGAKEGAIAYLLELFLGVPVGIGAASALVYRGLLVLFNGVGGAWAFSALALTDEERARAGA